MDYYILGIIFGIITALTVFFISWLIFRKKHPNGFKYDERQMIGRGKAFQAGFFTTLICSAAVSTWEYAVGPLPYQPFLWHIGALLLGIAAFAVTAIHFDAYVGMNDTPDRFIKIGILFIIAMTLIGIGNLSSSRPSSIVMAWLNLGLAILWGVILAALLLHRRKENEEDSE